MRRITIGCTGAAMVSFFAMENLSPPPGDPYRYPIESRSITPLIAMTPQYLMFTAIQMLGPAAVLALAATAIVAARKRPAVWSIAFCVTACLLFVGIVANHLAFSWFGSQEFTDDGAVFTRYEPILRFVGLLAQFVGFSACFIGSYSAIRLLTTDAANDDDATSARGNMHDTCHDSG